jgi:kynurenine 3-monooxygenase
MTAQLRKQILEEYSATRTKDAHAINDLALNNYKEMRASVTDPVYKFRKWLEERINVYVPSLGWATKYSRVSFGNEPYSEVVLKSEHQGRVLVRALVGIMCGPLVMGGLIALWRFRRAGGRIFLGQAA